MTARTWFFASLTAIAAVCIFGLVRKSSTQAAPDICVRIAAAVSLKAPLEEARPLLAQAAGMPVEFNFASSGALTTQIIRGAPIDLFISADRANVETLSAQGLVAPIGIAVIATNELVLIVPVSSKGIRSLAELRGPQVRRITLGDPKSVPAGRYAKESLEYAGLWEGLSVQHKWVMGESVAQVLAYVAQGEVDAGFVYRTDIQANTKVVLAFPLAAQSHTPIEYTSAVLAEASQPTAASAVRRALLGEPVQKILAAHGFGPPTSGIPSTIDRTQTP